MEEPGDFHTLAVRWLQTSGSFYFCSDLSSTTMAWTPSVVSNWETGLLTDLF